MVIVSEEDYLAHYGILRRSGRYPWGSGGNENTRNKSFLDYIAEMRSQGLTDTQIAKGLDIPTTQLRAAYTIAANQQRLAKIGMAQRLKDKGYSNVAIGERMGIPESTVRTYLAPGAKDRANVLTTTADLLKKEVDSKKYIDIGSGVESHLGLSAEKLNAAVAILREQGYEVHPINIPQVGTGLETRGKVLAPPGTTQKEVWQNQSQIQQIGAFSQDGGRSFLKFREPIAINPDRVSINYKEDGGDKADGVIYVRQGVEDVSLGKSPYAQVRIKIGDSHYLKGMAMYKDDLPDGVDLLFNTNKENTGNKFDAMKPLANDPELPFGSVVRQILKDPGTPNERVSSAMNIVGTKEGSGEEGSWNAWSRNLSSQFLSKQSPKLASTQLDITYERRKNEFDDLNALTNPVVKKKLLEKFADGTDSAAVHLKAAAMPRQNWHVILPVNSLPATQIYAPEYRNGERVALIRYPHGGTFEIPELTVNNRHAESRKLLGAARDAVGINHAVAQRLSGADFDGDTVLVIPNNQGKVKSSPALQALKNFDPQTYKLPKDSPIPRISPGRKQDEMGKVSNLITDMTIQGAPHSDIARAVRHSMVVIDAEKHNLNYKQSAIDNGIAQLKTKYQGGPRAGASTLISRAGADVFVPERKPRPQSKGGPINKQTGRKEYVPTGRMRRTKTGALVPRRQRSQRLAETDDAFTLVSGKSGTPMEVMYANHSNRLKSLANQARLASIRTPSLKYSASAAKTYSNEVASLNSKLALALKNRPLERQAQIIANAKVRAKLQANPELSKETQKKIKWQALEDARIRTGAKKMDIKIEQREWDAIQAGAISNYKLTQILNKADLDVVRSLASPPRKLLMTSAKTSRAQQLLNMGYTRAEVADDLGVSLTTLDTAINV